MRVIHGRAAGCGCSRSRAALFAVAGGIAYATIPDSGNVYTGCMLKNIGTVRLIDPSLPPREPDEPLHGVRDEDHLEPAGAGGHAGPGGTEGRHRRDRPEGRHRSGRGRRCAGPEGRHRRHRAAGPEGRHRCDRAAGTTGRAPTCGAEHRLQRLGQSERLAAGVGLHGAAHRGERPVPDRLPGRDVHRQRREVPDRNRDADRSTPPR